MAEKHKRDKQGRLIDKVRTDSVTKVDRKTYSMASSDIGSLAVPRMFDSTNPHARLYVANFDGTGNDKEADSEHATNIALLDDQLKTLERRDPRVKSEYLEGPGTQSGVVPRTIDGITGRSYDERLERMYRLFVDKAKQWYATDPDADIRLIATGFSRGADQAAGFVRMVHERGIQDYKDHKENPYTPGRTTTEWNHPPLRSPGKTLTSEILFDPVGTGAPHHHDRQPTSSTVSALQITARDERRNAFPSSQIVPPGRSPDGRFVGVTVPGAHSDIGGSYHLNGLSTLNFNLAADFLNAHSDVPLVSRLPEPTDPGLYVIHHSEDHMWFYRTSEFTRDGHRDVMGAQASPPHCLDVREIIACAPPNPFDPDLVSRVGPRYPVGVHSEIRSQDAQPDFRDPAHPDHSMYRSASVQLLELHVRSGFDLDPDQVDRLATGLVAEARRRGMSAIEDVKFGAEISPGRPSLHAFESFPGDVDLPRSRSVSIDALKALDTPPDVSIQQRAVAVAPEPTEAPLMQQPLRSDEHLRHDAASARAFDTTAGRQATPTTTLQPEAAPRLAPDDVRVLQQNLNALGMRDMAGEPVPTHGVYDIATQTAVARFQSGNALPVTGNADDTTRTAIQGQAFIAELRQSELPGHSVTAEHSRQSGIFFGSPSARPSPDVATHPSSNTDVYGPNQPDMARVRTLPPQGAASHSDPRHPNSPNHALYSELQRRIPDASEDRLVQFTAACRQHRITARNLGEIDLDEDRMTLSFESDDPIATPATIDLSLPPLAPEQAIQQIQQFDQQMDQIVQQSRQRSAQTAQPGPVI